LQPFARRWKSTLVADSEATYGAVLKGREASKLSLKLMKLGGGLTLGAFVGQFAFGAEDDFYCRSFITSKPAIDLVEFYGGEGLMDIFCVFPFVHKLLMGNGFWDDEVIFLPFYFLCLSPSLPRAKTHDMYTHTQTHSHTNTHTHTRTHTHTHTHTHTYTHTHTHTHTHRVCTTPLVSRWAPCTCR
jgi:hypothetical protein